MALSHRAAVTLFVLQDTVLPVMALFFIFSRLQLFDLSIPAFYFAGCRNFIHEHQTLISWFQHFFQLVVAFHVAGFNF